jgi:hypothetical protein
VSAYVGLAVSVFHQEDMTPEQVAARVAEVLNATFTSPWVGEAVEVELEESA